MRSAALALVVVGCAEPAPAVAPSSPDPSPEVAGGDSTAIVAALSDSGHVCEASKSEPGVALCDAGRVGRAAFAVVQSPPLAFFFSYYRRKPETSCESLAPVLNQLNVQVDGMKVVCDGDTVTFASSFIVPSRGFTREEIAAEGRRFQGLIQLMLREDALRERLE